ncbi:MAG: hypothetical protein K9M03_02165 [Kiritimatiellales bacterium]|nr:hypothetical protein [Kiritimatiellales bacterium]
MESRDHTILQEFGFSFEQLVLKSQHPNARPLVMAIMERGMQNGHAHPSEVIEDLLRQEGDQEARTNDGILVRKILNTDGSITIQAGEGFDKAEESHTPNDLTSIGLHISHTVCAVRTIIAERTDS